MLEHASSLIGASDDDSSSVPKVTKYESVDASHEPNDANTTELMVCEDFGQSNVNVSCSTAVPHKTVRMKDETNRV